MEFEMTDLKGILFLVLLKIISITSTNIDCNGKAFHCLNSTHFMICVDLGSGVSMTIDDFIILCPQGTVCERHNRFECEYPKISTNIYPLEVIGVTKRSETKTDEIGTITDGYASRDLLIHGNTLSTKVMDDVTLSNIKIGKYTESSTTSNMAAPEIATNQTVFDENDISNIKTKSNTQLYSPKVNVYNKESAIEATTDKSELKISMQKTLNNNVTTNNKIKIINKTVSDEGKLQTNFSNTLNISNFSKPIQQPNFLLKLFMNHNSNNTQKDNKINENKQQIFVPLRNTSKILSNQTSIIEKGQTTTLNSKIYSFNTSSVQTKHDQDTTTTTIFPTIMLTTPNNVLVTNYSINGSKILFRSQTNNMPLTELIKTTEPSVIDIILLRNRSKEFEHDSYIRNQNSSKGNITEFFMPKILSNFTPVNTTDEFTSDSTVSSIIFYDRNLSSINFTTAGPLTSFSRALTTENLPKVANEMVIEKNSNRGFVLLMNETDMSTTETIYMKDANLNKYLDVESETHSNNSQLITTTETSLSTNLINTVSTELTSFQNGYDDKNLIADGTFQTDNINPHKKLDMNVKEMPLVSVNLKENANFETTTKHNLNNLKTSKEQSKEKNVFNSSFTEKFPNSTLPLTMAAKVSTEKNIRTLLADYTDAYTVKKSNENSTETILVNNFLTSKDDFTNDSPSTQKKISITEPAHFLNVYITENPVTKPLMQTYNKDLSNVKISAVQEKLSSKFIYENSDNETTTEKLSNPTNKTEIFTLNYSTTPSMHGNYDQSLPITDAPTAVSYENFDKTSRSDIEDVLAYENHIGKIITEDVTNQYVISDLEFIVSTSRVNALQSEIINVQDSYEDKNQKIETLPINPNKNLPIQVFEMTRERPQLIQSSNQTTVNDSTARQTQLTITNKGKSDKMDSTVKPNSSVIPVKIAVYQDKTTLRTIKDQENSDDEFMAMSQTSKNSKSDFVLLMNETDKSTTETTYMKDANLNKYLNVKSETHSNNSQLITTTETSLSTNLINTVSTELTSFQNGYDDKNIIADVTFQTDNINLYKKLDMNVREMPLVSVNLKENPNFETTTKRTLLKTSKEQSKEKNVFNLSFTERFPNSTLPLTIAAKVSTEKNIRRLLADYTDAYIVTKANENSTETILVNNFLTSKNDFTNDSPTTQKKITITEPAHFLNVYITENPVTKPLMQTYNKDLSNVKISAVQEKLSSKFIYENSDNETTIEKLSNPTNKTEIFTLNYSTTPSKHGNYDKSLPITDSPTAVSYENFDKTSRSDIEDVLAYENHIGKIITEDLTNQHVISDLEFIVSTSRVNALQSEIIKVRDSYEDKNQEIETLPINPNKNLPIQVFGMTRERSQLIQSSNQTTVNDSTARQTQLTITNEGKSDKMDSTVKPNSSVIPVKIAVYQDKTTLRIIKDQENSDDEFVAMSQTSLVDEAITISTPDTYFHDVRGIAKITTSEAANQSNSNQRNIFEFNTKNVYSLPETSNDSSIFEMTTMQPLLKTITEALVLNSSFKEVLSTTLLPTIDVTMLPTKSNHTFLTEYKDANTITIENENNTDGISGLYFLANETNLFTQGSISTTKYISEDYVTMNPNIESLTSTYYKDTHKNTEEVNSAVIINDTAGTKKTTEKFPTTIFKTERLISNFSNILDEQRNFKNYEQSLSYKTNPSAVLYGNTNKTSVIDTENDLTHENKIHKKINKNVSFDSEYELSPKKVNTLVTEISNVQDNFINKNKGLITDSVTENLNESLPTDNNQITREKLKITKLCNETTVINSTINQTQTIKEITINSEKRPSAKELFIPVITTEISTHQDMIPTYKMINANINQKNSANEFMATTKTNFNENLWFADQVSMIPTPIAKSKDIPLKELTTKIASVENLKNDEPQITPNELIIAKPIMETYLSSSDDYSSYYEQPKVTTTLEITQKAAFEQKIKENNFDEKQTNYQFTETQKITNDTLTTATTDKSATIVTTSFHQIENVTKHQLIHAPFISVESKSTPSTKDYSYKGEFGILTEKPTEVLITYFNVTTVDKESEPVYGNNSTIIPKNYTNSYNKPILEQTVISENNISFPTTKKVEVDIKTTQSVASTLFTRWFNNSYMSDITKHDNVANNSPLPVEIVNDKVNVGYYNSDTQMDYSRTTDSPTVIGGILRNQLSTEINETKNRMEQKNILQAQETAVFNSSVKELSILDSLVEPINRKVNNINHNEQIIISINNSIAASKTNVSSSLINEYNEKSPKEYKTTVELLLTDSLSKSKIDTQDNNSELTIKVDELNKVKAAMSKTLNAELFTTQNDIKTNQNVNPFTLDQSGPTKLDAKDPSNPLVTLQSKILTQIGVTVRTKLKTIKSTDNDFNTTKVDDTLNKTDYNLVSTPKLNSNLLFNLSSEIITDSLPVLINMNDTEKIIENKYHTHTKTNVQMTPQIIFPSNVSVNENVYDFLDNLTDGKTVDELSSRQMITDINTYPVKTSASETGLVVNNHQIEVEFIETKKLKNYTITNVSEDYNTPKVSKFNHNTSELVANISGVSNNVYKNGTLQLPQQTIPLSTLILNRNSQKHVIILKPPSVQPSYINPLPTKLTHFNYSVIVQKNINNNTNYNNSYNNANFQTPKTTERANDVNTLKQDTNNTKLYLDNRNVTYENSMNDSTFNCTFRSRGKYPDNINCQKFYICIGKPQPMIKACPPNTVFSHIHRHCTKNLSHCVRNNQFRCLIEGRFGDFFQSNVYYICVKSVSNKFVRYKLQCQSGYYLNKITVKCEPNLDTSSLSTNSVSISENSQKSNENSQKTSGGDKEKFQCEKVGKFPDSDDCTKYYVCTRNGSSSVYRRIIKQCSSGEVFHSEMKKCVESKSYEC